ncbi:MAG: hypothetical protein HN600_05085 [Bacteroidetes bacterium]|jgi:hypothetical protein|nr:hypothetical protein [Bacteroidota bacterium]MBT4728393.1 hypothetical protein [Bacteroidota bacterium]MBT7825948.1 hypothetical protein [Bacteroidota bacterium]MBT7993702.1 hypothetical protein [Bacteroidota bacterium]
MNKPRSFKYFSFGFFLIAPFVLFIIFPNYETIIEAQIGSSWGAVFYVIYVKLYKFIGSLPTMLLVYALLISIYFLGKRKIQA